MDDVHTDRMPWSVLEVPTFAVVQGQTRVVVRKQGVDCTDIGGRAVGAADGERVADVGEVEAGVRYNDEWEARNDELVAEERNVREDHSGTMAQGL